MEPLWKEVEKFSSSCLCSLPKAWSFLYQTASKGNWILAQLQAQVSSSGLLTQVRNKQVWTPNCTPEASNWITLHMLCFAANWQRFSSASRFISFNWKTKGLCLEWLNLISHHCAALQYWDATWDNDLHVKSIVKIQNLAWTIKERQNEGVKSAKHNKYSFWLHAPFKGKKKKKKDRIPNDADIKTTNTNDNKNKQAFKNILQPTWQLKIHKKSVTLPKINL